MNNLKNIIWGILFISMGMLIGLKAFEIIDFDIFFNGWWTLFIIIPCFIDFITDDNKIGSLIGLFIGIVLLLACNDYISFELVWKLTLPFILIVIGLSFIFRSVLFNKSKEKLKINSKDNKHNTLFSSHKINYDNEEFKGCELSVTFGSINLNLRNAIIKEDVIINVSTVFGGVDIFVPNNCKIKTNSYSIFGGIDNKIKKSEITEDSKTIYINANCTFGGVDIRK